MSCSGTLQTQLMPPRHKDTRSLAFKTPATGLLTARAGISSAQCTRIKRFHFSLDHETEHGNHKSCGGSFISPCTQLQASVMQIIVTFRRINLCVGTRGDIEICGNIEIVWECRNMWGYRNTGPYFLTQYSCRYKDKTISGQRKSGTGTKIFPEFQDQRELHPLCLSMIARRGIV